MTVAPSQRHRANKIIKPRNSSCHVNISCEFPSHYTLDSDNCQGSKSYKLVGVLLRGLPTHRHVQMLPLSLPKLGIFRRMPLLSARQNIRSIDRWQCRSIERGMRTYIGDPSTPKTTCPTTVPRATCADTTMTTRSYFCYILTKTKTSHLSSTSALALLSYGSPR